MNKLLTAVCFAERAHRGQTRKYTGEPYVTHCLEVAQLVGGLYPEHIVLVRPAGSTGVAWLHSDEVVIAALLHDTVEDCGVSLEQIRKAFGPAVMSLVHEVTDVSRPEHGNRAVRKALDREHLSKCSAEGATIKLADMISNTQSITFHDPNFAKVYMAEKALLLPNLKHGNEALYRRANSLLEAWEATQK